MAAVAHTMDYRLIAANHDCAALLHLSPDAIAGRPVRDFIPAADLAGAQETARAVAGAAADSSDPSGKVRPVSSLRRLIAGDGQEMTCWMHVGTAAFGDFQCFIACIDLVNPVLSDAHRWRHRAEHDELTGLLRRGTLLGRVSEWMASGRGVAMAFLDVDNFKSINDTHGHAAGDHVLTTLARRLELHAPAGSVVGRLAGDEFVLAHAVSTPSGTDRGWIDGLAAAGARCVAEPIAWGDHLLMVSVSSGVRVSERGEDASALLSRADNAMYAVKSATARSRR